MVAVRKSSSVAARHILIAISPLLAAKTLWNLHSSKRGGLLVRGDGFVPDCGFVSLDVEIVDSLCCVCIFVVFVLVCF